MWSGVGYPKEGAAVYDARVPMSRQSPIVIGVRVWWLGRGLGVTVSSICERAGCLKRAVASVTPRSSFTDPLGPVEWKAVSEGSDCGAGVALVAAGAAAAAAVVRFLGLFGTLKIAGVTGRPAPESVSRV